MKKNPKGAKVAKMQISEERNIGRRTVARKEAKGKREKWQGIKQNMLDFWLNRTHCSVVSEGWQQTFVRH